MSCKNLAKHNWDFEATYNSTSGVLSSVVPTVMPSFSLKDKEEYRKRLIALHPLHYSVFSNDDVDDITMRTLGEWASRSLLTSPTSYYETLRETALGFLLFGTTDEKDNMAEILSVHVNNPENPFGTFRLDKVLREELAFTLNSEESSDEDKIRFSDMIMKRCMYAEWPKPNDNGDENTLKRTDLPGHIEFLSLWSQQHPKSVSSKNFLYNLCAFYNEDEQTHEFKVAYKIERVKARVIFAGNSIVMNTTDDRLKQLASPVLSKINSIYAD